MEHTSKEGGREPFQALTGEGRKPFQTLREGEKGRGREGDFGSCIRELSLCRLIPFMQVLQFVGLARPQSMSLCRLCTSLRRHFFYTVDVKLWLIRKCSCTQYFGNNLVVNCVAFKPKQTL